MSKVRADEYYDRAGTGRPSFPRGLTGVAVTVTNTTAQHPQRQVPWLYRVVLV